jgi:2-alkyl-3-oxoalkanoate reductase
MAMRVLVTGAGGFLGGKIARMLIARGDQVIALQRNRAPELEQLGIEVVCGDLSGPDAQTMLSMAAAGCDGVIHVAAKAGHWGRFEQYFAANVTATRNIIAACQALGISRLVYTSTPSVAHAGGDLAGVDESTPPPKRFHAHYPATKAIAERDVLAANSTTLSTCALRPHLIWGPGDNHLLPRLIARAKTGRLRFVGDARNLIDTIYVDNAAHAHLHALDRLSPDAACAGKAYFLSNDEPLAVGDIVNRLIACAGLPACNKHIPVPLAYVLGALMEFSYNALSLKGEPLLTRFVVEQLSTAHWFDIRAAKRDLGFTPEISIDQGLARLAATMANTNAPELPSHA